MRQAGGTISQQEDLDMLWSDEHLDPGPLEDSDLQQVLIDVVAERARDLVRPGHFFSSLLDHVDDESRMALSGALLNNARIDDLLNDPAGLMGTWCPHRDDDDDPLTGAKSDFSAEALAIIDDLSAMADGGDGQLPQTDAASLGLPHLWLATVRHPDEEDQRRLGQLIDFEEAEKAFARLCRQGEPPKLLDPTTGEVLLDNFSDGAIAALEEAAQSAGAMGFQRIMPVHVFFGLLVQPEGPVDWAVRLEAPPGKGSAGVAEEIKRHLLAGRREGGAALKLDEDHLGSSTEYIILDAMRKAMLRGREKVSPWGLAMAVASSGDQRLAAILDSAGLEIQLDGVIKRLQEYEEQGLTEHREPPPFTIPPQIGAGEDLTHLARGGEFAEAPFLDDIIDRVCRALYRRQANHVLIVGDHGIGKTTVVRELARRAVEGEIGFLERKRIVRVDTSNVPPEEAKTRLSELLALVRGRNDIILCIDGLGALLAADQQGSSGRPMLRAALKTGKLQMIGIMDQISYTRHLAGDPKELQYCHLVEMEEPDEKEATSMLATVRPGLQEEYDLTIDRSAMQQAVRLSASYILSERLPAKAVRVLRIACDNIAYERERRKDRGEDPQQMDARVTAGSVVAVVSEETDLPASTLRGMADEMNYRDILSARVVGQDAAIEAVAQQLELIKSGFRSPSRPASVMLFAGLTGTGKTELAKAIAQVYSASRTLQVYTMGNFTEENTVANLIGSPPGYVGYEQGGPLINDLNGDPYSVVLLDEVDKAHPQVWKPMLNLFDEGWIVDRRNVKAYGTRAVFILTSNEAAEEIPRMLAAGHSMDEIQRRIKDHLSRLRHRGQKRFPPEFLARIERVVIFRPLSREAMRAIARLRLEAEAREFDDVRGKTFTWDDEVVELIGDLSHDENERSDDHEGGRIVGKNVDEFILSRITGLMGEDPDGFMRACGVHVTVRDNDIALELVQPEQVDVGELSRQCIESTTTAGTAVGAAFEDQLEEVRDAVDYWATSVERWARGAQRPDVLEMVEDVREKLERDISDARRSIPAGTGELTTLSEGIASRIRETVATAGIEEGA